MFALLKDIAQGIRSVFQGGKKEKNTDKNATLRHLLKSEDIDPNRRRRAYSEKETEAYKLRKLESHDRQIKRLNSENDRLKAKVEKLAAAVEAMRSARKKPEENKDEQGKTDKAKM